jgi:hypothetical protein
MIKIGQENHLKEKILHSVKAHLLSTHYVSLKVCINVYRILVEKQHVMRQLGRL